MDVRSIPRGCHRGAGGTNNKKILINYYLFVVSGPLGPGPHPCPTSVPDGGRNGLSVENATPIENRVVLGCFPEGFGGSRDAGGTPIENRLGQCCFPEGLDRVQVEFRLSSG